MWCPFGLLWRFTQKYGCNLFVFPMSLTQPALLALLMFNCLIHESIDKKVLFDALRKIYPINLNFRFEVGMQSCSLLFIDLFVTSLEPFRTTRKARISDHSDSRHQNFGPIFQPKLLLQNQYPCADITGGRE